VDHRERECGTSADVELTDSGVQALLDARADVAAGDDVRLAPSSTTMTLCRFWLTPLSLTNRQAWMGFSTRCPAFTRMK
jgi:hypothetical protein